MKITVLDVNTLTIGDLDFSCIDRLGDTEYYDVIPHSDLADVLKDTDAVLINKAEMTREVIEQLPKLKYIGLFATGYNNVDLEAASKQGISVVNVPGYSTDAVAQHVFSFILMKASNMPLYNEAVHRGDWVYSESFSFFPYPINELAGKTLGIVGYGNIGRKVAEIGHAFGMKIMISTRSPKADCPYIQTDIETVFREADYLSLNCPLNDKSSGLVNSKTLHMMKPSAFLVNTSRGGVVVSSDLADALNNGIIAGAGIDVLPVEPMPANDPLLKAANCIITPHIGWAAAEARKRCVEMVADNIESWQNGNAVNVVNSHLL
ncbi:MAG: D-2-hydroxyacid dehydrogenase [Parasporobacterium sp.]|nr:D-2-hydroxyacid dehydrogenase [Parasporobacterium sp.]